MPCTCVDNPSSVPFQCTLPVYPSSVPFQCHASQSLGTSSCIRLPRLDMNSQQAYVNRMADRAWFPVLVHTACISCLHLSVSISPTDHRITWSRSLLKLSHQQRCTRRSQVTISRRRLSVFKYLRRMSGLVVLTLDTLPPVRSCESHQNSHVLATTSLIWVHSFTLPCASDNVILRTHLLLSTPPQH